MRFNKEDFPADLIWLDEADTDVVFKDWLKSGSRVGYKLGYRFICKESFGSYIKNFIYEKTKDGYVEIEPKVGMAVFMKNYGYVKVFNGSGWVIGKTNKMIDDQVQKLLSCLRVYKSFEKKVVEALDKHLEEVHNSGKQ